MKRASLHYLEGGGTEVRYEEPPAPAPKEPWVPELGKDRRDVRDPEKVGKQHLSRRRRRGA